MAAELPRPGVEVIQVFRTVSPTVVTPTLVPCVVGVCKQVLELYTQSSAGANQLNTGALAVLPATLTATPATGSPAAYTGLNALALVLSINNGPDVTITFSDVGGLGLSPASVAAQITTQFATSKITEAVAGYADDTHTMHIKTVGSGVSQTIEIMAGTAQALLSILGGADPGAIGWAIGRVALGVSSYAGWEFYLPYINLPDPNGNLTELVIEPDTVRFFLSQGGSTSNIKEFSRTQAYLRRGEGQTAAVLTGSAALVVGMYGPAGTLDAKTLLISLNGATAVTVLFGTGATAPADAEDVVQQINDELGKHVASIYAPGSAYIRLTSTSTGPNATVAVTGTAAAILGFVTPNNSAAGTASVVAVDDGDSDSLTPLIDCTGEDFTAVATSAAVVGLVDLTGPGVLASLSGTELTVSVDGKPLQTMALGTYLSAVAFQTAVTAFFGTTVLQIAGATTQTFTSLSSGEESSIYLSGGSALPLLGLVPYALATIPATVWRTAGTAATSYLAIATKKLRVKVDGTTVEHTFGAGPFANFADVLADLNGNTAFAAVAEATDNGTEQMILASLTGGKDSYVQILAATADEACHFFGWNPNDMFQSYSFTGGGYKPVSGDDLYVDGVLIGRILKVAPGSVVNRVKLDKEVTIDATYGDNFYMVAKNLPRTGGPTQELSVDGYGNATAAAFVTRDTTGLPVLGINSTVYVAYRAIRQDVTALASQPGLLRFDSTTQLEDSIAPITAENPLALGLYFALLNAPTCQVTGLGVDAVSADAPFGTVEAFTRAAEFLEAYEVYAMAPLTHDVSVGQVFNTHATAMSEPENKGERIVLFNWSAPQYAVDVLVASGNGNSLGSGSAQFDTGVGNLGALLLANSVSPIGTIPVSAGVFLDIYSDDKHYSVESVAGGTVTIRTAFGPGENDDSFYATAVPAGLLVDELFAIRLRGAPLSTAGIPDKQKIAETYQSMGQGVQNRRFWNVVPDQCAATVGGVEQVLDGFYLCAAIAGMIGQNSPQQSFTNFPMTGFTRVIGSNDYFSNKQLNIIAAGGNYIIVQDSQGVPLTARMALTTDLTSVETRTDSINKIVDYTAKFMRGGLKNFIGRFNITSSFIDTLSHVCQGLLGFLQDTGVLVGSTLNNIVQDENNPDTVLIDITLDVPYPCNYIRLTLVI